MVRQPDPHAIGSRIRELGHTLQRKQQFLSRNNGLMRMALRQDGPRKSTVPILGNIHVQAASSNADTGESEDVLQTSYTGEQKAIAFNSQYLLEFLKAVDCESVRLEFKDGDSASELRPEDNTEKECSYRYLVMPLRI